MKKALIIIASVLFAFTATFSFAATDTQDPRDEAIIGDILVLRPLGVVATAVGFAFYVVGLPFSQGGGNTKGAADTLVAAPATFTFARPVGDF